MLQEKLKVLRAAMPPLEGDGHYGTAQYEWLAEAQVLVSAWDQHEGRQFKTAIDLLVSRINRKGNYAQVVMTLQRAMTALNAPSQVTTQQVFGPGAVYDFFKALRGVVTSASTELLVVDPYLNAEVFDGYITGINQHVRVRLLASKYEADLRVASQRFMAQSQCQLEVRKSTNLHDRVVFVDSAQCWVLGASIKDAAKTKMTYLAPLSQDVATAKLAHYNLAWDSATAI